MQESVAAFAIANAAFINRGDRNQRDVSEALEAGHIQFLQSWGKTPIQIADIVAATSYECTATINYLLEAFHIEK